MEASMIHDHGKYSYRLNARKRKRDAQGLLAPAEVSPQRMPAAAQLAVSFTTLMKELQYEKKQPVRLFTPIQIGRAHV